jgi:DNA polymerase alpha subunit A
MADLLGEVDTNVVPNRPVSISKTVKSENRRKVRVLSPPIQNTSKSKAALKKEITSPHTPPDENNYTMNDDDELPPPIDNDVEMNDPAPSSPVAKAVERKHGISIKVEDEDEDLMEVTQAIADHNSKGVHVNITGSRPIIKLKKELDYPTPASSSPSRAAPNVVDPSTWNDVTAKLNVLSSSGDTAVTFGKVRLENAVDDDGSIKLFWTDYTEINGSLCMFGKVKDKSTGTFVSAFVKIDNILRNLFVLPRTHRQKSGRVTSDEVEMLHVYEEIDQLMSKQHVNMFKIKECKRKYAFERAEIPKEAEYMKLMYPYDKPPLPMDIQGETFSHIFGTNTALFEQFVLWKNIMGPCWLKFDAESFTPLPGASHCKVEFQVTKPESIAPLSESESMDAPPMTIMSLALRTTLNVKENKQEILMVSARIYENILLSDTTPADKLPCRTFTIMRPVGNSYPLGFDAACKKQRGAIWLEKSEQMLLSRFLAMLEKIDPDVLMGHGLQDVDYPVLLNRMKEKQIHKWHRIGRLQRSEWPKSIGRGGGSFFVERQLVAGRLICDIANDMGKSLMMKCQQYSISEMCSLYLGDGAVRQEIDNEVALKTWASTKDGLLNYVNHCEADTYFIAAIALRVQIIPLSKVLTNLAGNSWARTLSGTRAERNEYILLHEFYKNKYICPDKVYGKAKPKSENEEGEDGGDVKEKGKYKGGLVFEPEKGLYDKCILVMDFNSLYPSIIQEFNICFTTVERSDIDDKSDKVPEVPVEQEQGILPKLIATLVSRRREVKKLMKDKRATPEELATWDIKQFALKLTANSMYGCLGYTQSRFYARPLAMLTTHKGREILQSTKDLAESSQLRVVYGDTDSVMINTNVDSVEEALRVGNEFKRSVNERYKLLEIDIDNVFRRLLLHAKKKYAAINMIEVDGKFVEKLEVKGLDMKRREYCALAKEASSHLLNDILSGEDPEVVLTKIQEYLRELSQQMREEKIQVQKYTIYTVRSHTQVLCKANSLRNSVKIRVHIPMPIACLKSRLPYVPWKLARLSA